jgi:hypothetical protein
MAKRKLDRGLFVESVTGNYRFVDEVGKSLTLEEARALWETGTVKEYNFSLRRLVSFDWDVKALQAYYAECGATRKR